MPTMEQRVAALEAENAGLHARIAELTPTRRRPAAPEPEGASVRYELPGARFVMPTEAELKKLHAIVLAAYPVLRTEPGRFDAADAPFQRFANAFRAVGMLGRTDKPAPVALSYWVDKCEGLLRDARAPSDIVGHSLVAAMLAHGDVPFQPLDRFPFDLGFALSPHVNSGRPAGEVWRDVLASGKAPAPSIPAPKLPAAATHIESWG